ncbi:YciI family protein [Glaciibacter sp. 2TAF33]|uniref:YciI family protein n=1 Tax=Glaciibacter sp. 2TAF33 TaxID=3233015 RepID=UPI003F92FD0E
MAIERADEPGASSHAPMRDVQLWLVVTRNTDTDRGVHRAAHRDYMRLLVERGLVFASGPASVDHGEAPFGGATVLRVPDATEARRLMDDEPFIRAGARTYELIAWHVRHGDYDSPE